MTYIWYEDNKGEQQPIDKMLANVLETFAFNLRYDWDLVILVSGNRMVRVGKSVLAIQICSYLAYLLRKLKMNNDAYTIDSIYFDNKKLMSEAIKKPKFSIIHYDEGREGLAASKSMSAMQQDLIDYFTECGQLNHIFVIVLPDFFDLKETMAVPRSECLINVSREYKMVDSPYEDGKKIVKWDRGYFKFYNREAKNQLYDIFRTTRRKDYDVTKPSFPQGQFENRYPLITKEAYEPLKLAALTRFKESKGEDKLSNRAKKGYMQRNLLIKTLVENGMKQVDVAKKLGVTEGEVSRCVRQHDYTFDSSNVVES